MTTWAGLATDTMGAGATTGGGLGWSETGGGTATDVQKSAGATAWSTSILLDVMTPGLGTTKA